MSDKLIVEFYDSKNGQQPIVTVLAFYGGDNPSVGATTLADYFNRLGDLTDPRYDDAGLLSARFIACESAKCAGTDIPDFSGVALVPFNSVQGYQVARVYAQEPRPYVHFVTDEWTSPKELEEASLILRQTTVGPPF